MEQFLLDLMQAGYVISKEDSSFFLHKYEKTIAEGISPNLDTLVELAKQKIKWNEAPLVCVWDIEVMYKHRGYKNPRFESLGTVSCATYEEALEKGQESAMLVIDNNKDILEWEVRVRPAKI